MNRSETLRIEENTGMKITRPEIRRVQNLQRKLNQLVPVWQLNHLHEVFLLVRQKLQYKLFVTNFTSITTTCPRRSS